MATLLDNLVAYYKLDEASGTRNNSVGTNHLTDVNTVTTAAAKLGTYAGQFTRANSEYLSLANVAAVSGAANTTGYTTVAAWVYIDSLPGVNGCTLVSRCKTDASQFEWILALSSNGTRFQFNIGDTNGGAWGAYVNADTFGALSTGVWYYVVAYYDGTNIGISVNGGTADTVAYSSGMYNSPSGSLLIGGGVGESTSNYHDGRIDEVGIWKRALSSAEITSLYNSGSGLAFPFGVTTYASVNYLIVAGGAGGGGDAGGGGGSGGFFPGTGVVTPGSYPVVVGAGGAGGAGNAKGTSGNNSTFNTFTAVGGGGGDNDIINTNGLVGGSGGGGTRSSSGGAGTAGQGNAGGQGSTDAATYNAGAGGGGSSGAGQNASGSAGLGVGGNGANGTSSSISGSSITYAGGGGGGGTSTVTTTVGTGGTGGGGNGGADQVSAATAGTANTGGGGGGGGAGNSNSTYAGKAGGSGIVILSYTTGAIASATGGTITTSGGNTIHTFNSNDTFVYPNPSTTGGAFLFNMI